ncbi:hypothetical protein T484DRAFT_1783923 [Baffinella frigidus]|nr:hypothetical protein T484DRAFT_1783923 [Cryptophyta sp. CCMP2293]
MSRVVEGQDSAPSAEAAPPMEEKLAILAEEGAIVPPVDVVVHGWGTQEDLVEAVADVGQTWRRAQAQAVSGGGGAARATRRFDSGNEWSSFGARVASGDAYPRLRKFFHYGKSSCNLEQEVWFWDKKNPDAKQNPLKEYTILHVHHHGAVAGLPSATSEPGNLHVVDAVDARHLCRLSDVSMSYQGDNPFIDTYIESSNLPAYKAFPSSEWTCSKCQTANPLSGWVCKGGPRSGSCRERRPKRTCTDWNFNADPNKDVVLAAILSKSVAQGVQKWQRPKGKKWKTTTRGEEGEGAEPRACELSLDELMGLVGAGGTGVSGGAAAAGADQMQAGHVIYREARAVGGGATFGGGGRCPESSPDKFTVLFIGANVKGKEELKLDELEVEKEQERLWAAFKDEKGRTFFEKRGVLFVPDTFADVSDVIRKVGKRRPTVVHFACHGGEQGLHFSRSFLGSSEFAEFLRHHNDELPGSERVRLVIVNACKSGAFAAALTQWVDFAIGHGEEDAVDDEAIVFTEILYQNLGEGKSLRASFTAARTASGTRSYQLFCRRVDPKQWSLVSADNGGGLGAGGVGATVRGNEPQGDMAEVISAELLELKKSMWRDLCSFLHKSGRFGVAARLRDEVKVHSLEDFADLVEADFAAFVPFEGRRLVKLVPICREELAQRMSGTMADDGSVLSGTETELVVSDSGMTSDGESDSESVVVAARNLGDREHWKEHLQNLIFEFGDQSNRDTSVPFYMLMLVRFMWDADFSDLESRAEWRAALRDVEQGGFTWAEEDVCECFDRVVKQKGFRHRLLVESSFTTRKCRECIFVVDLLVRSCGKSQPQVAVEWQRRVWDGTASNPDQFFARANKFLHDDIDSICVLGDAIETKSYCAFLHMSKLTAFLLFGFLEMRKRRSEAGGQAAQGLAGFRLFVSSDGRVFSASQQDRPGWENLRGIGEGLRCLARLPREDLGDALVPMAQLAQDGVALKVPLVVDQLTGGDAAVASPLTAEFYRPSAEFLSAPVAASGGSSRPARTAAKCTCRVSKADLAASQVREEAMGRLRWWVESDAAEAPGRMLVCGVGGAGKSTLARMFAARAAAEGLREAVLFLTMSDGNRSDEYLELAKILEGGANVQDLQKMSEEKLRAHVHGLLESEEWEGRWLVVLDDLPDPGDEGASWVARDFPFGSGKTLVTSRSQGWIAEGGAGLWEKLALEGMSEGEACAWVRRRVEAWAGDEAGVLELVRKLGCFPLAIEQAAAFAREYSIETPALYLAEQAKGSSKLREKWEKRRVRGGYPLSFAEVISLTFGRLIEADDDDSVSRLFLC